MYKLTCKGCFIEPPKVTVTKGGAHSMASTFIHDHSGDTWAAQFLSTLMARPSKFLAVCPINPGSCQTAARSAKTISYVDRYKGGICPILESRPAAAGETCLDSTKATMAGWACSIGYTLLMRSCLTGPGTSACFARQPCYILQK